MLALQRERVATPLGAMLVVTDADGALRALEWVDREERLHRLLRQQYRGRPMAVAETGAVSRATRVIQDYFDGDVTAIETLAVATGGTPFQQAVWTALRAVGAGQTISYRELARRIDRPAAIRAAGAANGANPVAIVIPCHRVVGSDQALTGYAGGLHRKAWLLAHEQGAAIVQQGAAVVRMPAA